MKLDCIYSGINIELDDTDDKKQLAWINTERRLM